MTAAVLASLCSRCVERALSQDDGANGGVNTEASIKAPFICCVHTHEIHLDLHDGAPEEEEEDNSGVDTTKACRCPSLDWTVISWNCVT